MTGTPQSFACMYDNHHSCGNPRCMCACHTKKEEPVALDQPVPFHKKALLGLVKSHPESAVRVLEELIGGLPDSLDYCDLSSMTVAEELLHSLTKPVTVQIGWGFNVANAAAHPTPEASRGDRRS